MLFLVFFCYISRIISLEIIQKVGKSKLTKIRAILKFAEFLFEEREKCFLI